MKTPAKIFFCFSILLSFLLITGFFCKKKETPTAKIEAAKMNVLYYGLDNQISVAIDGIDSANLIVTSNGGKIFRDTIFKKYYIVQPDSIGKNVIVNVHFKSGKNLKLVGTQTFRVKKMPDPIARVVGGTINDAGGDEEISQSKLSEAIGLTCTLNDFDFNCWTKVTSFSMSIIQNDAWQDYHSDNNLLTYEMLNQIKKAKPGDRIFFANIKEIGSDGIVRKLQGISITVK
jgi:gliding motility-associated protein GldM